MFNLNNTQKRILKWLVNEADLGTLDENDIWVTWSKDGTHIMNYAGINPEITRITLDALEKGDFIICRKKQHDYRFSLTQQAIVAVRSGFDDNNMDTPSQFLSGVKELENIDHIDKEIRERCLFSILNNDNSPQAWDAAVRCATVVLEERLRLLANIAKDDSSTGQAIVNNLFGSKSPLISKIGIKTATAYRDLFSGLMLTFRNQYGHRHIDPEPEEGVAILLFINHTLKMLSRVFDQGRESH